MAKTKGEGGGASFAKPSAYPYPKPRSKEAPKAHGVPGKTTGGTVTGGTKAVSKKYTPKYKPRS